jgi:hypothetical protein
MVHLCMENVRILVHSFSNSIGYNLPIHSQQSRRKAIQLMQDHCRHMDRHTIKETIPSSNFAVWSNLAVNDPVRNRTLTLIEREDNTRS